MKRKLGEKAIVIGGGLTGLVTARVLSDYFQTVTVIERDPVTETGRFTPRTGVPQATQTHLLRTNGAAILMGLFPDIATALKKNGAYEVDLLNEMNNYTLGWKPKLKSGKRTFLQSRPLLDETIRSLMPQYPNIEILYDSEVIDLLINFRENRMTGIRYVTNSPRKETNLYGDLIVDASGSKTHFPDWLERLNLERPPKEEVPVNVSYFTRFFRWPEGYEPDWKYMAVINSERRRIGMILAVENDSLGKRWSVSIMGQFEGAKIETDAQFLAGALELGPPEFHDVIAQTTALTPIESYMFPAIRRYKYEDLQKLPSHFLAIGDALCAWTPLSGVGMTASLSTIDILNQSFAKSNLNEAVSHYFRGAKKWSDNCWKIYSQKEYYEHSLGKLPFGMRFLRWYKNSILKLCNQDPKLWSKMYTVVNAENSPRILYNPLLMLRVFWQALLER